MGVFCQIVAVILPTRISATGLPLVLFAISFLLSVVGRDCPSAHVELAEGDERPGQEAVRERWQEEQERSGNGRDRDRR